MVTSHYTESHYTEWSLHRMVITPNGHYTESHYTKSHYTEWSLHRIRGGLRAKLRSGTPPLGAPYGEPSQITPTPPHNLGRIEKVNI